MNSPPLSIIILAAGKGTRMKSAKAKVLHEIFFEPMIHHVLSATLPLVPDKTVVVVGHQQHVVAQSLSGFDIEIAVQEDQLGTGHAVLATKSHFDEKPGIVMILCGDTPLIKTSILREMLCTHMENNRALTLLTTLMDDPTNYGRIVSNEGGDILQIVEEKDASMEQRDIKEINGGIYCVDGEFLFTALQQIGTDNSQGEMYLTDIVQLAVNANLKVGKFIASNAIDVLGVNSRLEMAQAQLELQKRRNVDLMSKGISMYGPETIRVSADSTIEKDTIIEAGVVISAATIIGESCFLRQGTIIENCTLGSNVTVGPYSCLTGVSLSDDTEIASHTVLNEDSQQ